LQNISNNSSQCDEVLPHCSQCTKSRRECPGYPDAFDLIFRNETVAVERRARKAATRSRARNPRLSKDSSSSPTSDSAPNTPETPNSQDAFRSPVTSSPTTFDLTNMPSLPSLESPGEIWLPQAPGHLPDKRKRSSLYLDFATYLDSSSMAHTPLTPTPTEETPLNNYSVWPAPATYVRSNLLWGISAPQHISTISYFFHSHVLRQRHADTQKGFLELLGPMYAKSSPGSLLHRATYAVAMGCLSATQNSVSLKSEARKEYGNVLIELSSGIKTPKENAMNEMILSILLCSLCEQITGNTHSESNISVDPRAWTRHVSGAVALVKMRGRKQLADEESRRLFRAVRSQMLKGCLENNTTVEDFPDIEGWSCDRHSGDINGANRLTILSLELPRLRCRAKELISMPKNDDVVQEMLSIIEEARQLDRSLATLFQTLPDVWAGKAVAIIIEDSPDITKAEFWPGPQVVYEDLNVAGTVAEYRVIRIICSGMIRQCIQALPACAQTESVQRMFTEAVYIARDMVNQICSTVPYFLGYGMEFRNDGTTSAERACKFLISYLSSFSKF
jgi:hypothetical protein